MNYNWVQIGDRIKQERENAGLSQSQLMQKIGRSEDSYRILGRWEKGITQPCFTDMLSLCNVFECELGYLLCEYNCKTRENTDIQEVTGLPEEAIKTLKELKEHLETYKEDSGLTNYFAILSHLLISKDFPLLIRIIDEYMQSIKNGITLSKNRVKAQKQFLEVLERREDTGYSDISVVQFLSPFLKQEATEIDKRDMKLWRMQQYFIELVKTIVDNEIKKN